MTFATVRDLKNRTSEMLRKAGRGKDVLITNNGRPVAVLHGLSEDDLEDWVLSHSPKFRRMIEEADREIAQGRTIPLSQVVAEFEAKARKRRHVRR